jgi:hypothetical protein
VLARLVGTKEETAGDAGTNTDHDRSPSASHTSSLIIEIS